MDTEKRIQPRFEPAFIDVDIEFSNHDHINGEVLDSSRSGMAISLPDHINLPSPGINVGLIFTSHTSQGIAKSLGNAKICRVWDGEGLTKEERGIAVQFEKEITDSDIEKLLLRGIQQQVRKVAQSKISFVDMDYLGEYRRDLVECQVKLFSLALSVGATIAGAYFGLTYYSITINQVANPDLSFWRTMVAALPGILAMACAIMAIQKSISIQRIDTYLSVLKEYHILEHYPREYKGWETESRKFRHILGTNQCNICNLARKCGEKRRGDPDKLKSKNMFNDPLIDLYHIVMHSTFFTIVGISCLTAINELLKFQWGVINYMVITFILTLGFFSGILFSFYTFYHLRKGHFSYDYFKRCWRDLLARCRVQV